MHLHSFRRMPTIMSREFLPAGCGALENHCTSCMPNVLTTHRRHRAMLIIIIILGICHFTCAFQRSVI